MAPSVIWRAFESIAYCFWISKAPLILTPAAVALWSSLWKVLESKNENELSYFETSKGEKHQIIHFFGANLFFLLKKYCWKVLDSG